MSTAALLAERPVTALRGVGPALAELLAKLGLHTVQDVLFHLPLRYEDRTRVVPIGTLRNGDRAVIEGEIQLTEVVFRRRRTLLVRIADGTGFVTLRFFHFSGAQQAQLGPRPAPALLRRSTARSGRSRDRASGIPTRARRRERRTARLPDADLSDDGRRAAGTAARAHRHGADDAVAGRNPGLRATRRARRLRAAAARSCAALRASAAPRRQRRRARSRPAPSTATARVRGTAGASAEPATAAAGNRQGRRVVVAAQERPGRALPARTCHSS